MTASTTPIVQHLIDGRPHDAAALAKKMLKQYAHAAKLWDLLGVAQLQLGQAADAVASLQRACQIDSMDADTWDHLGVAQMRQGQHTAARASFERSTALAPEREGGWSNALENAALARWSQLALDYAGRAAALPHTTPATLLGMARHLALLGQSEPSIALHRQAIARAQDAGAPAEWLAEAHTQLGHVLGMADQLDAASAAMRAAIALHPERAEAYSPLLFSLLHDEHITPAQCRDEHMAFGRRVEGALRDQWQPHANDRSPQRRLRVGFVSGDLVAHAVAHFIEPVWRALDTEQVELWVYANNLKNDNVTERLQALVPHWRMVADCGDVELATVIRNDRIDILIDLSGHTLLNRLLVFARKPAPIQASWIGYPGSTGLSAIDYSICDRFNAPPGRYEQYYCEKFARLPSASVFQPAAEAGPVQPLPALRKGAITFGSFNRPGKLSDAVVAAWSRVLLAVPQSSLLLCPVAGEDLIASLTERFKRLGVAADRLQFQPRQPLAAYLELHHQIDIMLDSWPYASGTTANHAIWMGVPLVTLRGPSRAHCQGGAVMSRLGLDDWVADDIDAFVRIAIDKASDLQALAALRAGMRQRSQSSPWRQPETVARGLEAALRHMWQRWCDGLPPEEFEIAADALPTPAAPRSEPDSLPVLRPDMPLARQLLPWLEGIDAARQYTNFGPLVQRFENALGSRLDGSSVVSTSSCTAALELALLAHQLPPSSCVLLPSFGFAAAAGIVRRLGLQPLFADVDALTWQLTPHIARAAAKHHPLALVLPASTFGCPVDASGWDQFVTDTGIPVLIDAAAAFGQQSIGAKAAVTFSFHATKPFGIGEGGAFVTREAAMAARVRQLSNFGYANSMAQVAGTNAKLSEYAAAVGLAQLARWPDRQRRRHQLWEVYAAALAECPGILLQQGFQHGALPAAAVLRLPVPAATVAAALKECGIETRRWYCPPLHLHPAFSGSTCIGPMGDAQLMNTEFLASHALGLPWYADLSETQCVRVAHTLRTVLEAGANDR